MSYEPAAQIPDVLVDTARSRLSCGCDVRRQLMDSEGAGEPDRLAEAASG